MSVLSPARLVPVTNPSVAEEAACLSEHAPRASVPADSPAARQEALAKIASFCAHSMTNDVSSLANLALLTSQERDGLDQDTYRRIVQETSDHALTLVRSLNVATTLLSSTDTPSWTGAFILLEDVAAQHGVCSQWFRQRQDGRTRLLYGLPQPDDEQTIGWAGLNDDALLLLGSALEMQGVEVQVWRQQRKYVSSFTLLLPEQTSA